MYLAPENRQFLELLSKGGIFSSKSCGDARMSLLLQSLDFCCNSPY